MAEKRTILGDTASAGPTMAALRAVAAEPVPDIAFVSVDSNGVVLIYGRDEAAIEAGTLLADHLDVTVVIARPRNLRLPRDADFPVVQSILVFLSFGYIALTLIADLINASGGPSKHVDLVVSKPARLDDLRKAIQAVMADR